MTPSLTAGVRAGEGVKESKLVFGGGGGGLAQNRT